MFVEFSVHDVKTSLSCSRTHLDSLPTTDNADDKLMHDTSFSETQSVLSKMLACAQQCSLRNDVRCKPVRYLRQARNCSVHLIQQSYPELFVSSHEESMYLQKRQMIEQLVCKTLSACI